MLIYEFVDLFFMAVRQDKSKEKKSLKDLLREKDRILITHPEVVYDDKFADYRPPQGSKLTDAYKRYNELLEEIESYVNDKTKGSSALRPRGR